jgi:citrate lyase subunit alpha/citrate CoA-transferase
MTVEAKQRVELVKNAAGRKVPTFVSGRDQVTYQGVGKYKPEGRKAAPPVRSNAEFPKNGDKRVPDLETALKLCGLSDGMTISSHHHLLRYRRCRRQRSSA